MSGLTGLTITLPSDSVLLVWNKSKTTRIPMVSILRTDWGDMRVPDELFHGFFPREDCPKFIEWVKAQSNRAMCAVKSGSPIPEANGDGYFLN